MFPEVTELFETGSSAEAERLALAALETEPASEARAHLCALLGKISLDRDELPSAEKWFEMSRSAAANAEASYGLGLCAVGRGSFELARQAFDEMRATPGQSDLAVMGRALLASAEGKASEALSLWGEAVEKFPQSAGAHLRLGECLADMGDVEGARSHLRRSVELGMDDVAVYALLDVLALAAGDLEVATKPQFFDQAAGAMSTPTLTAREIRVLLRAMDEAVRAGDCHSALVVAECAHRLAPETVGLSERLGALLYTVGRREVLEGQASCQTAQMLRRAGELLPGVATRAGVVAAQALDGEDAGASVSAGAGADSQSDPTFEYFARLLEAYRRGSPPATNATPPGDAIENSGLGELAGFIELLARIASLPEGESLDPSEIDRLIALAGCSAVRGPLLQQREALNLTVVAQAFAAQGRKHAAQLEERIRRLARSDPDGFWQEAYAFSLLIRATRSRDPIKASGDLESACSSTQAVSKPFLARLGRRAHRARIAALLGSGKEHHALAILRDHQVGFPEDPELARLRTTLDALLGGETLEVAQLAARTGDVTQARRIWAALAAGGDVTAAHHLAVSLTSASLDQHARGEPDALATLVQALPYWKQVQRDDSFWKEKRLRCQALHSSAFPFRTESLLQIRKCLSLYVLEPLGRYAIQFVRAGRDEHARACVRALLGNPFGPEHGRQTLEEVFAEGLLADGPLASQQALDEALDSAATVLSFDPQSRRALHLAFRAAYRQRHMLERGAIAKAATALLRFHRVRELYQASGLSDDLIAPDRALRMACCRFWREYRETLSKDLEALHRACEETPNRKLDESERSRLRHAIRADLDCAREHVHPACQRWGLGTGAPEAGSDC